MKIVKQNKFSKLVNDNKGATMVEYALMLALILVLAYVGFRNLGKAAGSATSAF
jgi:Flp pilus assembly pilin Flp